MLQMGVHWGKSGSSKAFMFFRAKMSTYSWFAPTKKPTNPNFPDSIKEASSVYSLAVAKTVMHCHYFRTTTYHWIYSRLSLFSAFDELHSHRVSVESFRFLRFQKGELCLCSYISL